MVGRDMSQVVHWIVQVFEMVGDGHVSGSALDCTGV